MLCVDTLACFVVVVFVEFKADKVPFLLDARHGGRAATHAVVKDGVAIVGIGAHEIAQQVHRLLGWMPILAMGGILCTDIWRKYYHIQRETQSFRVWIVLQHALLSIVL